MPETGSVEEWRRRGESVRAEGKGAGPVKGVAENISIFSGSWKGHVLGLALEVLEVEPVEQEVLLVVLGQGRFERSSTPVA